MIPEFNQFDQFTNGTYKKPFKGILDPGNLERLVISYGEDVRVIYPPTLRDRVAGRLKSAHNQYIIH